MNRVQDFIQICGENCEAALARAREAVERGHLATAAKELAFARSFSMHAFWWADNAGAIEASFRRTSPMSVRRTSPRHGVTPFDDCFSDPFVQPRSVSH